MACTSREGAPRTSRRTYRAGLALTACAVVALAACSAPAPEEAPQQPALEPGVQFSDGFESGNTSAWLQLAQNDDRIAVVGDPVRSGNSAVRLTADQDDFGEGENVRTQLNGPVLFNEGDEAFISWSTYFPPDMVDIPPEVWFTFFELHGEPFDGSPLPGTFDLEEEDGQQFIRFTRAEQYGYDSPWSVPLEKGRWYDFVIHVGFSENEDQGFFELWLDGAPQTFADGSSRLQQSTIMENQDEGLFPILTNYYRADSIDGPVTLFHDSVRVAETYELAAADALAPAPPRVEAAGEDDGDTGDDGGGGDDGDGDGGE